MGFKTKIKTSSPRLLNAWLLFATIIVIALFLLFYSVVYVRNNEKQQIAKRFRVLTQIGENVVAREKGFRSIGKNVDKGAEEEKEDKEKHPQVYIPLKQALEDEARQANELLQVEEKGSIRGNAILTFREVTYGEDTYIIYIRVEDFFEPLRRPDVFDGLIILEENHNNRDADKNHRPSIVLYHTFPGDIDWPGFEMKKTGTGIEAGSLQEIDIANKKYKLFLQPLKLTNGNKWYLGGVIENKTFEKESGKFKAGVLTPFFMIFTIFFLSIPLLKLCLMSRFERLDISDVLLTSLSIVLVTIALVLFSLIIFQANNDSNCAGKSLKTLAEQIEKKFTRELTDACKQLTIYDSSPVLMGHNLDSGASYTNILTNPPLGPGEDWGNNEQPAMVRILNSDYDLFKVIFWVNDSGQQVLQFTTRNYGGRLINVGSRKYFQEAGHWQLPGKPDKRLMLQSITSMTSGEKMAAISMKSNIGFTDNNGSKIEPEVVAMTSRLTSVIDTIMPAGYGFCIIDRTGEVWFHSNTQRNLQENFIHEAGNNTTLVSAIKSSQAKTLKLDYQNMIHKCYVRPIPDIPLYIITFHDIRYQTTQQSATILHTVIFILALCLFTGLLFVIASWSNYKKSLAKRKFVPFEWLKPLRKHKEIYPHLVLANIVFISFLAVFALFTPAHGIDTFFFCMSIALFSFVYNYHTITGKEGSKYPLSNLRLLVFFLVVVLLIDVIAWWAMDKFILLPIFQVVLSIVVVLLKTYKNKQLKIPPGKNWGGSYVYFLLTWLAAICVIPVILFYIHAYNYESEVALRHFQTTLAQQIEERDFNIREFYNKKIDQSHWAAVEQVKNKRKNSGIYANICYFTNWEGTAEDFDRADPIPDHHFNKIAYLFKPPMNRMAAETRDFVFPAAADQSRTWKKHNNQLVLKYKKKNALDNSDDKKNDIYVVSTIQSFKMPLGLSLLLLIIGICLVIGFAYFLVRYSTRMIFGLNLLETGKNKRTYIDAQDEIRESVRTGADIILYCPTKKEMEYCRELFCEKSPAKDKFEAYYFDLHRDTQTQELAAKNKSKKVFVENFELYPEDIDGNLKKTQKIVSLLRLPNIQVIIPAFLPLPEIIEYYEGKPEQLSPEKDQPPEETKSNHKKIIDLLSEITNSLVPLYLPLKTNKREVYPVIDKIYDTDIKELIKNEFAAAEYFKGIEPIIYQYYKKLHDNQEPITEEKMILKIRELARPYYNQLLNSCSGKEKYVLYDIAQDTLVNANNLEAINSLLKKGLLVYDGAFKLMNESFRDFILTAVNREELELYVSALSPKWRSYKTPLLLIALGVGVFFAFQEDVLGKVDALVTTAIGGIAIITRFSGLFLNVTKTSSK
ncbi:MAG: hypothetical protein PVH61_20090 [Candidatus Aminicenantes bacterium]|jgi:hypothetical protein